MDDVPLWTMIEWDIDLLIHTTRIYIDDIWIWFGLNQWGTNGDHKREDNPDWGSPPTKWEYEFEDSYKYLGILQANRNLEGVTRKSTGAKYLQWVR